MIDKSLFTNYKRVALAVSGGKDSMTLLDEFARSFCHDFFYVLNIEHGIRGAESVADSDFVESYAHRLGVECVRYNVDAVSYSRKRGYTLEQGARLMRREIFEREVREGRCDRVVVAHHLDDNVESILMHIFRGSGLRGIKGMDVDDGTLVRPLLSMSRRDIDALIKERHIPYREDSTNSDTAYRRNFIRREIMPVLESRYPGIDASIMRLSNSAREDNAYLDSLAEGLVTRDQNRFIIDLCADDVLVKRAIYSAFIGLGVTADIEERHYSLLLGLRDAENGTTLDMPYGVKATLEYGRLALYRPREIENGEYSLHIGDNVFGDYILNIEPHIGDITSEIEDGYRVLYADADEIDGATIRARRSGDTFEKFAGRRKKLKDYLIDIKVPREQRDMPLIVRDGEVLVVAGAEISNKVSISDHTDRIYKIKLRRQDI